MPKASAKPHKQPVQSRSQLTVQAILEAAIQVFEAHGHAGGTTARIAERAGVSIGSLYQYFPNKDAILHCLADQHLSDADAAASRLLAYAGSAQPSLIEAIDLMVDGFMLLHRQNPVLHRLLYEEGLLSAELRERARRVQDQHTEALADLLAQHPQVRSSNPALQAYFVVEMVEHFTHQLVIAPPAQTLPMLTDELKRLLLGYLAKT